MKKEMVEPMLKNMQYTIGLGDDTGVMPVFYAPLKTNLNELRTDQTPTYTRNLEAYAQDHEGILRKVAVNAARFGGTRNVTTYIDQPLENVGWVATGCTKTNLGDNHIKITGLVNQGDYVSRTVIPNTIPVNHRTWVLSWEAKFPEGYSGDSTHKIYEVTLSTAAGTSYSTADNYTLTAGAGFVRICTTLAGDFYPTAGDELGIEVRFGGASFWPTAQVEIRNVMLENVSGRSNQTPDTYIAPSGSAAVVNTAYYPTTNANQLLGPSVVSADGIAISNDTIRGLLIEQSSQNLCLDNTNFIASGTAWNNTWSGGVDITENNHIAPDGSNTASLFAAIDGTSDANNQTITLTADTDYCISCYFKANTSTRSQLQTYDSGNAVQNGTLQFDWDSNGEPSTYSNQNCSNVTYEPLANDWWRVSFNMTVAASGITTHSITITPDRENGTGSVWIWGPQVELGLYPSSFILTVASPVTRPADVLSYDDNSVVDLNEGTFFADLFDLRDDGGSNRSIIGIHDVWNSGLTFDPGTTYNYRLYDQSANFPNGQANDPEDTITKHLRIAGRYSTLGNIAEVTSNSTNGNKTDTDIFDSTGLVEDASTDIIIGGSVSQYINGYIKDVKIWDDPLTSAKLASLVA